MKKLSDASLKVIYIFVAIVVIALAYVMGVSKNMTKHSEIEEQNEQLQVRLNDLIQKSAQSEQIDQEIATYDSEMATVSARYPSRLTEQKIYYLVNDMVEKTGVEFSSIAISLNNLLTTNGMAPEAELGNNITDDEGQEDDAAAGVAATGAAPTDAADAAIAGGEATPLASAPEEEEAELTEADMVFEIPETEPDYANLSVYESTITLPFSGEYDEVKELVKYVTENEDHMSLGAVSAAFDTKTGLVSGSITIYMYAMNGNGKPYKDPEISGIDLGAKDSNIFGSYSKKRKRG